MTNPSSFLFFLIFNANAKLVNHLIYPENTSASKYHQFLSLLHNNYIGCKSHLTFSLQLCSWMQEPGMTSKHQWWHKLLNSSHVHMYNSTLPCWSRSHVWRVPVVVTTEHWPVAPEAECCQSRPLVATALPLPAAATPGQVCRHRMWCQKFIKLNLTLKLYYNQA